MRTLAIVVTGLALTLFSHDALAGKDTWVDRVMKVALGNAKCADRVKGWAPIAADAERAGQKTWAAVIYMNMAQCTASNPSTSLAYMERAVKLGYAECSIFITDKTFTQLVSSGKGRQLMSRIKIAPADHHESLWLTKESMQISHDTTMMITENMNRKDGDATVVPQSALPTRSTRNPYIRVQRQVVSWLQLYQRYMVNQSDRQRINHLVNMGMINNMGGRSSGPSQQQIMMSRQIANQNAMRRRSEIMARKFRSKGGNAARACTSY